MDFKSGFVNIFGKPNVGKSTLMNALVGERLSAITNKAQTTRHRIKGICTTPDYQIVFSDTPGILDPHYKLHESMVGEINQALEDADIILYILELGERSIDEKIYRLATEKNLPVIIVLNKVDNGQQEQVLASIENLKSRYPSSTVIPVSGLHRFNLESLMNKIVELLPVHPAYYPEDELTDRNYRFFVSEIIREKILELYQKEVPYSVEVVVDAFKEEETIVKISVWIFVARETQKIIILGKGGSAIKQLGIRARKEIEEFLGKKVFLELSVKVEKDWRDNEQSLRRFGYQF